MLAPLMEHPDSSLVYQGKMAVGTPGDWAAIAELATFAVRYQSEFPQAICSLAGPTPQSPPMMFCKINMGLYIIIINK